MRYIINDDDYEEWIEKLEEVHKMLVRQWEDEAAGTIEYIINEMKAELSQHLKPKE